MGNVTSECWLAVEFTEMARIGQRMKRKVMVLHEEFVNESVGGGFTIH